MALEGSSPCTNFSRVDLLFFLGLGNFPLPVSEDTNDGFSTASISSHAGRGGQGTQTNTGDSDSDSRMVIPASSALRRKRKHHLNTASCAVSNSSSRQTTRSPSPSSPTRSSLRHPHVVRVRNYGGLPYQRARSGRSFITSDSGLDGDQYADDEEEEEEESPSPVFAPPASHSVFGALTGGADQQTSLQPFLQIVEQPEQFYRARYACEGCRGPIKGRTSESSTSGAFPTLKVSFVS